MWDMLEERLRSLPKRRREGAKVVMLPVGSLPGSGSPYMASHDRTSLRLRRAGQRRQSTGATAAGMAAGGPGGQLQDHRVLPMLAVDVL